jgi:o-succinylbenzoate synthase
VRILLHPYEAWGGRGLVVGFEEDGILGWSDLRPWPTFGTPSFEDCLLDLRYECKLPLVQNARRFAALDREAKRLGTSLFEGLCIPKSHLYVTNWSACVSPNVSYKIKALPGGDLVKGLSLLPDGVRVRLDWNGAPSFEEALTLLQALGPYRERIEWIEDPCPFVPRDWEELSKWVEVVKDREPWNEGDKILCYKPGMDGWPLTDLQLLQGKKVLVSQVLGSILDAFQTAWVASKLQEAGVIVVGGFLTERLPVLPISKVPGWGWEPQTSEPIHA